MLHTATFGVIERPLMAPLAAPQVTQFCRL